MNVLAVDPGPHTGLAALIDGEYTGWEEDADGASQYLDKFTERYDLITCESFTINAGTVRKGRQGQRSIELIGLVKYFCQRDGVELRMQSPSDAKTFSTDDKLKAAGFWVKGSDHARDAGRHLLLTLVDRQLIDPSKLVS